MKYLRRLKGTIYIHVYRKETTGRDIYKECQIQNRLSKYMKQEHRKERKEEDQGKTEITQ